ncbi:MAG TPA: DNA polymerase/3'-5' exonuclease PolX [Anaerolineaceae bacterium]
MDTSEICDILTRIGNLLEIQGENVFKIRAYHKAAENLAASGEDINLIFAQGRLREMPGIGPAIADKISELLTTGKLEFLEKLEAEVPPSLLEVIKIPGIGPKKAAMFWKEAKITTVLELENAARAGKLRTLPGMGEKSEAKLLENLALYRTLSARMTLAEASRQGARWLEWLRQQPGVTHAEIAGSLRRWRDTVGDLDLVASTDQPTFLVNQFILHPKVVTILSQGENKASVALSSGVKIQLWIQPDESFGALLQYATGSKYHNVALREIARQRGYSLNERGLTSEEGVLLACSDEETVYHKLSLPWIPPELREDRGEIKAAQEDRLPLLVNVSDQRAELHTHSTWSDGVESIASIAKLAISRGLKLLAITDHSGGLGVAGGLSITRLLQQREEIHALRREVGDRLVLLQGAEVEIRPDGSLDYPDEILAELDIVIASLHYSLSQPREVITSRLLNAIRNPHVDIIGHPSGRLLPRRAGADLDYEQILEAAREHHTGLEINASPYRLDLTDIYARRAGEMGIPLAVNTDAHSPADFDQAVYGYSVARRAWLTASQVINTWQPDQIVEWLKTRVRPS